MTLPGFEDGFLLTLPANHVFAPGKITYATGLFNSNGSLGSSLAIIDYSSQEPEGTSSQVYLVTAPEPEPGDGPWGPQQLNSGGEINRSVRFG